MDIVKKQQGEDNLWHFKIGGDATDGNYRLADLSRDTNSPEDWLAANQAEAQALIDAGYISEDVNEHIDFDDLASQITSEIDWLNMTIPDIDTMTAAQVRDVVKRLAQENRRMFKAWRFVVRRL